MVVELKTVNEEVIEDVPASFVVTSFDSSGKLIQETTPLNAADPLTYEAEKLFGIDLNDDDVQGRNVQEFDRDAFITDKGLYHVGTDNIQTLLTDIQSGELLSADSSDISIQTLLTNKDGSSFVSAPYHTAIDIEQSDDGYLRLLSFVEAHQTTRTVKEKVTKRVGRRNRTVTVQKEVQEDVPASFVVTSFDSSGKLIQETTPLNAADPLTYEAEKLFGIDLNNDNVLGRNVKEFDRDAFTDANDIETFDGASDNKTLLTDQNSGEILFSDLSDPDLQKLLTN